MSSNPPFQCFGVIIPSYLLYFSRTDETSENSINRLSMKARSFAMYSG